MVFAAGFEGEGFSMHVLVGSRRALQMQYAWRMAVMIYIRNVSDDLHRKLKARAALAGMSVSEYLLQEIEKSLARPTPEKLRQRLRQHGRVDLSEPVAKAVARNAKVGDCPRCVERPKDPFANRGWTIATLDEKGRLQSLFPADFAMKKARLAGAVAVMQGRML
jgi:plasmid stability protein